MAINERQGAPALLTVLALFPGIACADCPMPYKRTGALKISDHHVRSPLLNIQRACQTCHKWPEAELLARVEGLQERVHGMRDMAMDALMDLIADIKAAQAAGAPEADLKQARDFQRRAQFYLDFVEAENSTGFHAPEEAERILGESVNFARKGQLALRPLRSAAGATLAPAPVKGPSGNSTAAGSGGGSPRDRR